MYDIKFILLIKNYLYRYFLTEIHKFYSIRFCLQSKKGGLVKIYDSELMPGVSVMIFCTSMFIFKLIVCSVFSQSTKVY